MWRLLFLRIWSRWHFSLNTQYADPLLVKCWSTACDAGPAYTPTFDQRRVFVGMCHIVPYCPVMQKTGTFGINPLTTIVDVSSTVLDLVRSTWEPTPPPPPAHRRKSYFPSLQAALHLLSDLTPKLCLFDVSCREKPKKAVTAYCSSKQLLPSDFAEYTASYSFDWSQLPIC